MFGTGLRTRDPISGHHVDAVQELKHCERVPGSGICFCDACRGRYAPGTTNADTYWDRPWLGCLEDDHMPTPWAPPVYYSSPFDDDTATNQLALAAADDELRRERQKVQQQQQRQAQLQAVH